jgi:hypothetical protein
MMTDDRELNDIERGSAGEQCAPQHSQGSLCVDLWWMVAVTDRVVTGHR